MKFKKAGSLSNWIGLDQMLLQYAKESEDDTQEQKDYKALIASTAPELAGVRVKLVNMSRFDFVPLAARYKEDLTPSDRLELAKDCLTLGIGDAEGFDLKWADNNKSAIIDSIIDNALDWFIEDTILNYQHLDAEAQSAFFI